MRGEDSQQIEVVGLNKLITPTNSSQSDTLQVKFHVLV